MMCICFRSMHIRFWLMRICNGFFVTSNGFFMTLKSDPHYLNLTLRTLFQHNCALEHYHSLPCNQFLASNAHTNTNADSDVKCEQGFTNKWGIYVDILILQ